MIFPNLMYESTVQVNDRTRLDANESFANTDTITNVEIEPNTGDGFIPVYDALDADNIDEKWYLDWAYTTDGTKVVTVRVTTTGGSQDLTYSIECLTEVDDMLFSKDSDLFAYEPSLKRYLPQGKSTFKYAHRAAQDKIIAYLDEQRIWKTDGTKFVKSDLLDLSEFKYWSVFQTLLIIFESSQLNRDDYFEEKRQGYEKDMISARKRGAIRLDFNGDGTQEQNETMNFVTTRLVRR